MKKGSVLVVTLWVLSLLTIFSAGIAKSVSSNLTLAGHVKERLSMYYFAKAGLQRGICALYEDKNVNYDSLNEKWASSKSNFKKISVDNGYFTLIYHMEGSKGEREFYGVMDENSLINVNYCGREVLQSLLEQVGGVGIETANDIANAIVDWRDEDNIVSPGGAEDKYYQGLTPSYECKDKKFESLEELLLVKGMEEKIFSNIKSVITIFGSKQVNVNTADLTVFYALGLSKDLSSKIIQYRKGDDGVIGTEDDNIFKTVHQLHDIGVLFTEESEQINKLISKGILTVKSNTFRIASTGFFEKNDRRIKRNITCVIKRKQNSKPDILYWQED